MTFHIYPASGPRVPLARLERAAEYFQEKGHAFDVFEGAYGGVQLGRVEQSSNAFQGYTSDWVVYDRQYGGVPVGRVEPDGDIYDSENYGALVGVVERDGIVRRSRNIASQVIGKVDPELYLQAGAALALLVRSIEDERLADGRDRTGVERDADEDDEDPSDGHNADERSSTSELASIQIGGQRSFDAVPSLYAKADDRGRARWSIRIIAIAASATALGFGFSPYWTRQLSALEMPQAWKIAVCAVVAFAALEQLLIRFHPASWQVSFFGPLVVVTPSVFGWYLLFDALPRVQEVLLSASPLYVDSMSATVVAEGATRQLLATAATLGLAVLGAASNVLGGIQSRDASARQIQLRDSTALFGIVAFVAALFVIEARVSLTWLEASARRGAVEQASLATASMRLSDRSSSVVVVIGLFLMTAFVLGCIASFVIRSRTSPPSARVFGARAILTLAIVVVVVGPVPTYARAVATVSPSTSVTLDPSFRLLTFESSGGVPRGGNYCVARLNGFHCEGDASRNRSSTVADGILAIGDRFDRGEEPAPIVLAIDARLEADALRDIFERASHAGYRSAVVVGETPRRRDGWAPFVRLVDFGWSSWFRSLRTARLVYLKTSRFNIPNSGVPMVSLEGVANAQQLLDRVALERNPAVIHTAADDSYFRMETECFELTGTMRDACLGAIVARRNGCLGCHSEDAAVVRPGPSFRATWNTTRQVEGGRRIRATDEYFRRSIREPSADIERTYDPIMPTYPASELSDADLDLLTAYLRSLR